MDPILSEYESDIDAICGTMVRICFSLPGQRNNLLNLAAKSGVPLDTPLRSLSFANGNFNDFHTSTIKNHLHSLKKGGHDEILIGNICISFIYSLWEDKYRPALAKRHKIQKNTIQSELFKELAMYRHAIIHNHAIGTSKTENLKLLPTVSKGTAINIDRHAFEFIVKLIKQELYAISHRVKAGQLGANEIKP